MRNRSVHGGRHELGQNFLVHRPTVRTIIDLVAATEGPILEIGAGDGALTKPLAHLGRALRAVEIDEHRADALRSALPGVDVRTADGLRIPLDHPVIVGNIPFHLTTPLLRRLLSSGTWRHAVLLTQWEVARKRAGVGGITMMTAQSTPWFTFALRGRIPRSAFRPMPSVDGGILDIRRRSAPLLPPSARRRYEAFVHHSFTDPGRDLRQALAHGAAHDRRHADRALASAGIPRGARARDLAPEQWASLWRSLEVGR
ncbi:23S ribosomal RNA methyltransferase Erm [Microbacterium sp. NPDC056052]|uniref:23S ribosomal RNA methyltransferase Erm n=1 Tax=Microbacterium sp. NPDC056052 TaxID=3345695 RepID=UPI0035D7F10D